MKVQSHFMFYFYFFNFSREQNASGSRRIWRIIMIWTIKWKPIASGIYLQPELLLNARKAHIRAINLFFFSVQFEKRCHWAVSCKVLCAVHLCSSAREPWSHSSELMHIPYIANLVIIIINVYRFGLNLLSVVAKNRSKIFERNEKGKTTQNDSQLLIVPARETTITDNSTTLRCWPRLILISTAEKTEIQLACAVAIFFPQNVLCHRSIINSRISIFDFVFSLHFNIQRNSEINMAISEWCTLSIMLSRCCWMCVF